MNNLALYGIYVILYKVLQFDSIKGLAVIVRKINNLPLFKQSIRLNSHEIVTLFTLINDFQLDLKNVFYHNHANLENEPVFVEKQKLINWQI